MDTYFSNIDKIQYHGPQTENPLAFRWYNPEKIVLGKTMAEQLRMAACYWHTFCWQGNDPFGGQTMFRPWFEEGDPMLRAKQKLGAAFEFFEKLGVPYFCFHDRDVAPEGDTLAQSNDNLDKIAEEIQRRMDQSGLKLLWGTANLFSHHRYMSGAATNPDPEIFAYAAAQVKHVLEVTHQLGGDNYVMWGGREGYDSLLNTDLKREAEQLGRFMNLVVEHKYKIGFTGTLLIEPKPQEPTKHQYDYDSASVFAFLQKHGLADEIKVNIEANHATLAGHSFEHELDFAITNGIFGSIDMNRGDPQNGWDTDQFPNNLPEVVMAMYTIFRSGGFNDGGLNFDAKLRRQSIDPVDMFYAHIGGMDICARALLIAEKMLDDQKLENARQQRYIDWNEGLGTQILQGEISMAELASLVHRKRLNPQPRSGHQEYLENMVNTYLL
jgi:xylose isomerase